MPVIEVRFDRYQFSTENSISQLADRRRLNQCPKLQPTKCGVETTRRDLDDQRNFSSTDWKSEYRLSGAVRQSSIKVGEERSGRNRWHRSTVLANFRFIFSRSRAALLCAALCDCEACFRFVLGSSCAAVPRGTLSHGSFGRGAANYGQKIPTYLQYPPPARLAKLLIFNLKWAS